MVVWCDHQNFVLYVLLVIIGGQSGDFQKFRKHVLFHLNHLTVSRLVHIIEAYCIINTLEVIRINFVVLLQLFEGIQLCKWCFKRIL